MERLKCYLKQEDEDCVCAPKMYLKQENKYRVWTDGWATRSAPTYVCFMCVYRELCVLHVPCMCVSRVLREQHSLWGLVFGYLKSDLVCS